MEEAVVEPGVVPGSTHDIGREPQPDPPHWPQPMGQHRLPLRTPSMPFTLHVSATDAVDREWDGTSGQGGGHTRTLATTSGK